MPSQIIQQYLSNETIPKEQRQAFYKDMRAGLDSGKYTEQSVESALKKTVYANIPTTAMTLDTAGKAAEGVANIPPEQREVMQTPNYKAAIAMGETPERATELGQSKGLFSNIASDAKASWDATKQAGETTASAVFPEIDPTLSSDERMARSIRGVEEGVLGAAGVAFSPVTGAIRSLPGGEKVLNAIGSGIEWGGGKMADITYRMANPAPLDPNLTPQEAINAASSTVSRGFVPLTEEERNSEQYKALKTGYTALEVLLMAKYGETKGKMGEISKYDKSVSEGVIPKGPAPKLSTMDKAMQPVVQAGDYAVGKAKQGVIGLAELGVEGLKIGVEGLGKLKTKLSPDVVTKRTNDLYNIESNYSKTRKAQDYSKDGLSGSRERTASVDIWDNAVDSNGLLRTQQKGGAIEQYKAQTIDGVEGVVRQNLERLGEKVNLDVVKNELTDAVNRSGLVGNDLINALKNIDKEIEGYRLKADADGNIPLVEIHDAKIGTSNKINYQTPPETSAYRKAIANGLKKTVEKNSKFNVEEVNGVLTKFYKDIEYLEMLDGKRVKGSKLGKYFAQTGGQIAGGIAGSIIGGPVGAALGTVLGGEIAGGIKGASMAKTLSGKTGLTSPKSSVLEKAVETGKSERPMLPAPTSEFRTQMGSGKTINLPSRTESSVEAQSYKSGNRNTIQSTNPIKTKNDNIADTTLPQPKGKVKPPLGKGETPKLLTSPSKSAKVGDMKPLLEEAKKYKSAEEFVKTKPTVYHGTAGAFGEFSNEFMGSATGAKSAKGAVWFTDSPEVAKAYSIYAAEEGPVRAGIEEASRLEKIAQKSGKNSDWKKYDAKVKEYEELSDYEKIFERRKKNANVKEVIVDGDFLKIDAKGKTPQELSAEGDIDSWLNQQLDKARKMGKDGVMFKNLDDAVGLYDKPSTHYAIFDTKNIFTKEQLKNIWEESKNNINFHLRKAVEKGGTIEQAEMLSGMDKNINPKLSDALRNNPSKLSIEEILKKYGK